MSNRYAPVILLAILCLSGCKSNNAENTAALEAVLQASLPPEGTNAVNTALETFMPQTPYSALVENTAIEVLDLPKGDPTDYHDSVTYLYTAKVLETYRGPKVLTLEYKLISETGEAPILNKRPYIVTLCNYEGGYLWPGIGASLPATIETVQKARDVRKILDSKQEVFSDCE